MSEVAALVTSPAPAFLPCFSSRSFRFSAEPTARYVVAESLRSVASIRSRLRGLKDALGTLSVAALNQTETIEDFKREYDKTRSIAAVNRTLAILRHACSPLVSATFSREDVASTSSRRSAP